MDAPPVQYVKTRDGYDLACFVSGEGQTVIRTPVLWNHISRQWREDLLGPLFGALAKQCRLVLYDGRGQGLSTRGLPETLSFEDLLVDLDTVIERFCPRRFVLFGMSFEGSIAIKYAMEHPERVEALVLWEYIDFYTRSDALLRLAMEDWPYFVETTARTGFAGYDAGIVQEILYDAMSQSDHVRNAQALRTVPGESLLRRVTVPTLILANRSGLRPLASEESAKKWASFLPNSQLVLFHEGSNFGKLEDGVPEAALKVADFLRGLGKDSLAERRDTTSLNGLSAREIEVIRLIAAGHSNQQIADELVISLNTVRRHVSNIYVKIGAANRTQAATFARDHAIV